MKIFKLLFATGHADLQGKTVIQAEHTHNVLTVDILVVITHHHIKGLIHGQLYKILHLLEGTHNDIELMHIIPSGLYKLIFLVYNNGVLLNYNSL